MRTKRRWYTVNNLIPNIITIQKNWRRYMIQNRLKLAGAGVLKRSVCHNSEEMITLADKTSVSPLCYFSFEESNKIFWFDIRSLARYWSSNMDIVNPYTRQPIPMHVRSRFRKLCKLNHIRIAENKWIQVCQRLQDATLQHMNPELLQTMNRTQLFILMRTIYDDWRIQHVHVKYLVWIQEMFLLFDFRELSQENYSNVVSDMLLGILIDARDPIFIGYTIIDAIQRM